MYYNGNNRYSIYHFLNIVHAASTAKYTAQVSTDTAEAAELQAFFQQLKMGAQAHKSGNPVDNEIIDTILYNIQMSGRSQFSHFNVANLFSKRGGARFEHELTRVIEAVFASVSDSELDTSLVNIGSVRGGIDLENAITNPLVQKALELVGTKTYHVLKDQSGNTFKQYYLPEVDGKIDVRGYQINIRADASPQMVKIYNMLSQATFSAKNYDSMTWDEKVKMFKEQTGHTTIKLGSSNIVRALASVLSDLNYDEATVFSAIYSGLTKIMKEQDDEVATHFQHLRFIYELIGAGFQYGGTSYGGVKYLIYNDPHGNIYVKSTAQILSDILNDESIIGASSAFNIGDSSITGKTISISKSDFH